jgi:hypothetical protein
MSFKIFDNYCKSPFKKRVNLIHNDVTIKQVREHFKDNINMPSMTRDLIHNDVTIKQVREHFKDKVNMP